jgi:hypothetical protein
MARKVSFKRGTSAQKARSKVAESLKRRGGRGARNPFALATFIAKRAGTAGRKRLASRGLRKRK